MIIPTLSALYNLTNIYLKFGKLFYLAFSGTLRIGVLVVLLKNFDCSINSSRSNDPHAKYFNFTAYLTNPTHIPNRLG